VELYTTPQINIAFFAVLDKMLELSKAFSSMKLSNDSVMMITQMQTLYFHKFDSSLEQTIHGILLEFLSKAELMGPTACLEMLEHVKNNSSKHFGSNPHQNLKTSLSEFSSDGSTVPNKQDFSTICLSHIPETFSYMKDMLSDAIKYSGFSGKISVEKTNNIDHIEVVDGYNFEIENSLISATKIKNPLIVCIDGLVESVSEIHNLLTYCNETKNALVVVSRGFSPDVLNTFSVNRNRGTLNVFDAKVVYDLNSVNTIVDIAIVSKCDVVSSLKGELITNIDPKSLSYVDEVIMSKNKIIIKNSTSKIATNNQIKLLREKRMSSVDDVQKILDKRIRSLIPNHVVVRIKDDIDFVVKSQYVDHTLRLFKSMNDYGVIIDEKMQRRLFSTFFASKYYAYLFLKTLNDIGAMLIEDCSLPKR
jgi:hypothetical protein